jgi:hypothetical protein
MTGIAAAFVIGFLLGVGLGWWGPERRSIDWGTAGEWVPGLLTGAATVAALWWAVSQFRLERQDRHRYEQRRTLSELRTALGASESSLAAITEEIFARAGGQVRQARPLDQTVPLVLSHMEARQRIDVLSSELDDEAVADLAQKYLEESLPLATGSDSSGRLAGARLAAAHRSRTETYEQLVTAIGQARNALV